MKRKNIYLSSLLAFFILGILVIFSQIYLLNPIVGQGLTNEDYVGLFKVRLYYDKFFTDPISTWIQIGLHDAPHDFYIAVMNILFGENYTLYLYTNIFFKIIATLLLYPLILLITKNRLLAFLTTLLYAISYPSAGALYLYVVGNEYLGVALVNLFFITYYLCIKKLSIRMLLITSCLISFAYLTSAIRIFPVFVIVLLVELLILLKNKLFNIKFIFFRLVAIFLPVIVISLFSMENSGAGAYSLAGLPDFLKLITDGNWFLILNPIWGLGYLFLPVYYFPILGQFNLSNFSDFIFSLFNAEMIFIMVGFFLSLLMSEKWFRFLTILLLINFFLNIVVFILTSHHLDIPKNLQFEYTGPTFSGGLYTSIFISFIISISATSGIEWYLSGRKNQLLFFIFVSPFLSLIFIGGQWLFTRQYYLYQEGIHRYFVIPAIGVSFFIASILAYVYERKIIHKRFAALLIVLITISIFNISQKEISQLFTGKKNSGRELQVQKSMQTQAFNYIPKEKARKDLLIYIKFSSSIIGDANRWEDTFDWRNLTFWMPIKRSYITQDSIDGCVALTWDFSELRKMAKIQNGVKGFIYTNNGNKEARCVHKGVGYSLDGKFIDSDNLYAFAIDEQLNVINLTEEVKSEIFR